MAESMRTLANAELLDALRVAGPAPSLELVRAALARGAELAPALRDMLAQTPPRSTPQDDPRWYAELHAGMLLIGLRDEAALPIFAQKLRTTEEDEAEVFLEWFNAPLAHYGGAAVSLLLELFADRKVPVMTRFSVTEPLVLIAQRDPAERERIVAGLRAVLPQVNELGEVVLLRPPTDDDVVIWSWALEALATLQDVAVVPQGVALYEADLIDEMVMGDVDAFLALIKARTPRLLPQPPEILAYYRDSHGPLNTSLVRPPFRPVPSARPDAQQPFVRTQPKVGRNDPCPCGSGKKYKKCHGQGK